MSVSSIASRLPSSGGQARYADTSYGRPPSQPQAFSASSLPSSSPSSSYSQFSGTVRPTSSIPSASPVNLSSTAASPLSSDDRSAAIADYVEKRRQAKMNSEVIRKERAREAEMRRMNGRGSGGGGGGSTSSNSSSSGSSNSSPPMPRSGIVTGASSTSSSEANSASSSRRASRGRDGQQAEWGEYEEGNRGRQQQPQAAVDGEEEEADEEEQEPLHKFAKPLSRTTSLSSASNQHHQQPAAPAQSHHHPQQQQQRPSARPLSPSAALPASRSIASSSGSSMGVSVSSLQSRVSELEAQVAGLQSQQRQFLAFMETTQSQLALLRGGADPVTTSRGAAGSGASKHQSSTQRAAQAVHPAAQADDSRQAEYEYKEREARADRSGRRGEQSDDRRQRDQQQQQQQRYQYQQREEDDEEREEDEAPLSHNSRSYSGGAPLTAQRKPLTRPGDDGSRPAALAQSARPTSRAESATAQPTVQQQQQRTPSRSPPPQRATAAPPAAAPVEFAPSSYYDESGGLESDPYPEQSTSPCPNCGRSFNAQALQRHVVKALCQKVARKPFDPTSQRLGDVAAELNQVAATDKRQGAGAGKKQQQQQQQSKWRQERARLQEAIQAGKQITQALKEGKPLSSIPVAASSIPDDRVQCPHCLRRFAEHTADRHIPHCKNTQSRMASKQSNAAPTQKRR